MIVYNKHVPVDTENVFEAMGVKFMLSPEVKEYNVSNQAYYKEDGTLNDFTNEAFMTMIRVVASLKEGFFFYNQKDEKIDLKMIQVLGVSEL